MGGIRACNKSPASAANRRPTTAIAASADMKVHHDGEREL